MMKNEENNGREEVGLVTPTPELVMSEKSWTQSNEQNQCNYEWYNARHYYIKEY